MPAPSDSYVKPHPSFGWKQRCVCVGAGGGGGALSFLVYSLAIMHTHTQAHIHAHVGVRRHNVRTATGGWVVEG